MHHISEGKKDVMWTTSNWAHHEGGARVCAHWTSRAADPPPPIPRLRETRAISQSNRNFHLHPFSRLSRFSRVSRLALERCWCRAVEEIRVREGVQGKGWLPTGLTPLARRALATELSFPELAYTLAAARSRLLWAVVRSSTVRHLWYIWNNWMCLCTYSPSMRRGGLQFLLSLPSPPRCLFTSPEYRGGFTLPAVGDSRRFFMSRSYSVYW